METILMILIAFGGGVFGSVVSGTIAFIFTGIMALVGIAISLSTGNAEFLNTVAFGPFFGPHVAFVGAVSAAAFAGLLRKSSKDKDLYPVGSDVNFPLFHTKSPMTLIVGGVFGVLGYYTNILLGKTGFAMDTVALTVVIYGLAARFIITRSSLMSPKINNPKNLLFTSIWSLGFALVTSFIVIETGINNIGWAVSAVSLVFMFTTVKSFPASHHVTMVAGYFALASGNILIGAVAGVIAALLGEFVQAYTNTDVDAHLDMPAVVIIIGSIIALNIF